MALQHHQSQAHLTLVTGASARRVLSIQRLNDGNYIVARVLSSDGETIYDTTVDVAGGKTSCACRGHRKNPACCHVRMVVEAEMERLLEAEKQKPYAKRWYQQRREAQQVIDEGDPYEELGLQRKPWGGPTLVAVVAEDGAVGF